MKNSKQKKCGKQEINELKASLCIIAVPILACAYFMLETTTLAIKSFSWVLVLLAGILLVAGYLYWWKG